MAGAGTPIGVHLMKFHFRWCRFAQPPATSWDAKGIQSRFDHLTIFDLFAKKTAVKPIDAPMKRDTYPFSYGLEFSRLSDDEILNQISVEQQGIVDDEYTPPLLLRLISTD